MVKIQIFLFVIATAFDCLLTAPTTAEYESNIVFYGFKDSLEGRFVSSFNTSIADQGCEMEGNFAMVVHGWKEGIETFWVNNTVEQLLTHRGGCVFFMDYSNYSKVSDYFRLVSNFLGISDVLLKKFKQIGNYGRQYCYGFSFGSRLCIDAGINIGNQSIDRMDLCDPAGPGFDGTRRAKDPKLASKRTSCINTSTDKGTSVYNCHKNFRMGKCGSSQPAAGPFPLGSHGLCPHFYNIAFNQKFAPNNHFKCTSRRLANVTSRNVRMGYLDRSASDVVGDIFVATAKYPNYLVLNGIVDNKP